MIPRPVYRFKATPQFWKRFYTLPSASKEAVRSAWRVFKVDPFAPRLGTHKIHSLSARAGETVCSVVLGPDLRAVFYIREDTVWTFDIGSHSVYR
jgi:hypothetical protein